MALHARGAVFARGRSIRARARSLASGVPAGKAVLVMMAPLSFAASPARSASPPRLAVWGDSLTAGDPTEGGTPNWVYGLPESWQGLVLGFGGAGDECETNGVDNVIDRYFAAIDDPSNPVHAADVQGIFCGTNSVRRPSSTWNAGVAAKDAIESMADDMIAHGWPVVFVCAPPIMRDTDVGVEEITIHDANVRLRELCDFMRDYSEGRAGARVADIWPVYMASDDPETPSQPCSPDPSGCSDPGPGTAAPPWNPSGGAAIEHASEEVCTTYFGAVVPCKDPIHPSYGLPRRVEGEVIAEAVKDVLGVGVPALGELSRAVLVAALVLLGTLGMRSTTS